MEAGTPGRPAEHPERHHDDLESFGLGVVLIAQMLDNFGLLPRRALA